MTFKDGLVEPVKKIIYPDSEFNEEQWITREQLFLVKGFQPPLLNVKPESQFDMHYKIKSKFKNYSLKGINYKDCIELYGNGSTSFIGDTRSGPIEVKIINKELICKGVGLIKQIRYENTDASAFGNMSLEKILVNFENYMTSVTFVIPVFNKATYLKHVIKSIIKQKGRFEREFIFINDGSTDSSLKILRNETKKMSNCRIINQKNMGSAQQQMLE